MAFCNLQIEIIILSYFEVPFLEYDNENAKTNVNLSQKRKVTFRQ